MILGFVVFWPLGLAMLAWMCWQQMRGASPHPLPLKNWLNNIKTGFSSPLPFGAQPMSYTGNSAFDGYKQAEITRLQKDYQRLLEEEKAFADFLVKLRQAKDREEFDRFLAERRQESATSAPERPSML
jgi:Protein of unknown function (DUF2852)